MVVDVTDDLRDAVQVAEPPIDGKRNRRAAFSADKIIKQRCDDGVRLLAVAAEIEDGENVCAPASQVVRVLKQWSYPSGLADSITFAMRPKRKERLGRFARAFPRV